MNVAFSLPAIPPFNLQWTVWALKRRERNIIDQWTGSEYIRIFDFDHIPIKVRIQQKGDEPKIQVKATSQLPIENLKRKLSSLLTVMLGLQIDLGAFYARAEKNRYLSPLVKKFKGVKPPRFPSLFETLANAIACQQLSLEAGLSILNRFVQEKGLPFQEGFAFPDPKIILDCQAEELVKLGFSHTKSETLIRVAASNHQFDQVSPNSSNEDLLKFLMSFKGIGRWSAEYVLLRGFGKLETLPGDDVAVQKNIQRLLHLRNKPDFDRMKKIEKEWHPFAGLIYFHLLLEKIFIHN